MNTLPLKLAGLSCGMVCYYSFSKRKQPWYLSIASFTVWWFFFCLTGFFFPYYIDCQNYEGLMVSSYSFKILPWYNHNVHMCLSYISLWSSEVGRPPTSLLRKQSTNWAISTAIPTYCSWPRFPANPSGTHARTIVVEHTPRDPKETTSLLSPEHGNVLMELCSQRNLLPKFQR